jgi:hypothetical protein
LTQDATTGPNAHVYTYAYDSRDNRTFSNDTGNPTTWTYTATGQLVTGNENGAVTSFSYDTNGNLTLVVPPSGSSVTMAYDVENRMNTHVEGGVRTTYTYDGDGLKRSERAGAGVTTLLWDGRNYLGAAS